jgi:antitoxin (DNA-binding transcriptional repressor) of toxin-antitoxin stability system
MSTYTVVQARSRLSELIKRAHDGEGVVITRRGEPTVELKVIAKPPKRPKDSTRPDTAAESEFLRLVRSIPDELRRAAEKEAREMRDEGEA